MIMHDANSGDSDLDLGDDFSDDGWGSNSDLEAEFEDISLQDESYNEEVGDNAGNITNIESTSATPPSTAATPTSG